MPRRWTIFLLVAVLSIGADQATKAWAHTLPTRPAGCALPDDIVARRCAGVMVEVVPDLWHWRLAFNSGAAFSTLHAAGARWLFVAIALAALGYIGWSVHRRADGRVTAIVGLGLIAGGCLGNVIDRLRLGVVTDFVFWHYHEHPWPVFNVADVVLVVGALLLIVGGRAARGAST